MANISVGGSAKLITKVAALVQNLGTGVLYIDTADTVSSSTGLKVEAGDAITLGGGRPYYAISSGTSDVRILPGAVGGPATLQS